MTFAKTGAAREIGWKTACAPPTKRSPVRKHEELAGISRSLEVYLSHPRGDGMEEKVYESAWPDAHTRCKLNIGNSNQISAFGETKLTFSSVGYILPIENLGEL